MTNPYVGNIKPDSNSGDTAQTQATNRVRSFGMGSGPAGVAKQAAPVVPTPGGVHPPGGSAFPYQPSGGGKKKRGAGFWIAIVVAVIAIVVACILAFTMCGNTKGKRQGDSGQLEGKSYEEIQAELDRVVEEGMFNISIASVAEFPDGNSEGELRIENVPGNRYLMKVTLIRNDNHEKIYETGIIEPDHHIQSDKLDVVLPAGSYECTATFDALNPETEESVGQAAALITVNVLK